MGRLIGIVSEYRDFPKNRESVSELNNSDPIPIPKRFFADMKKKSDQQETSNSNARTTTAKSQFLVASIKIRT